MVPQGKWQGRFFHQCKKQKGQIWSHRPQEELDPPGHSDFLLMLCLASLEETSGRWTGDADG